MKRSIGDDEERELGQMKRSEKTMGATTVSDCL